MRWLRRRPASGRELVLDAQGPEVRVEGIDHLAGVGTPERIAVVAHWAPDCRVDRSVTRLVAALDQAGYEIVVVTTVPEPDPLPWPEDAATVTLIRRPNIGYDFGSWATALDRYPAIASADKVLLLNTSLAGPFAPVDHLLAHFEASTADAWGMTDSTQFGQHLQSYCLGFRGGSLREGPLARFWREIRVHESRDAVIEHGELELGRLLRRERFVTDVAIPSWRIVANGQNPVIVGWRRLLDEGFPFVKRQLLRDPGVARDGMLVGDEVGRRFGVVIDDWV